MSTQELVQCRYIVDTGVQRIDITQKKKQNKNIVMHHYGVS